MWKLAHSSLFDDTSPAEIWMDEDELPLVTWDLLTLPELGERRSVSLSFSDTFFFFRLEDDDPFREARVLAPHAPERSSSKARPPVAEQEKFNKAGPRPTVSATLNKISMHPFSSRPRSTTASASVLAPQHPAGAVLSTTGGGHRTAGGATSRPLKPSSSAAPAPQKTVASRPHAGAIKVSNGGTKTAIIPGPRAATSASIRNRTTDMSVAVGRTYTNAVSVVQRSSTAASSYKTGVVVPKKAVMVRGGGSGPGGRGGGVGSGKRVPWGSKDGTVAGDGVVLVVQAGEIEVDEFRFNV